jgi:serine/threonine protein kinase
MDNSIGNDKTMAPEGGDRRYTLSPSQTLGQYRIVKPLGKGGMGEVYLVEHEILRTRHALKLLPTERAGSTGFLRRFRDEARVMAQLQHFGIVHVQYADVSEGHHFLIMDFVACGENQEPFDLEAALASAPDGRLEPEVVARLATQICDAVGYAHAQGVVHRDLKPSNVLLTDRDLSRSEVRVTDFGLARLVGEDWLRSVVDASMRQSMSIGGMETMARPGSERSSSGSILGTYEYMSPEQREGGDVDERSDIFALGVMLYRMVTGKRLVGRAKAASKVIVGLDRDWDELIDACLEEDPSDRPDSMAAVAEGLGELLSAEQQRREAVEQQPRPQASPDVSESHPVVTPSVQREGVRVERVELKEFTKPIAKQPWLSPSTGMAFVWIEALGIWVGKYEVTNAEYRKMEAGHSSGDYQSHDLNGDRQPVVLINFDDATAYAARLTQQDRARGALSSNQRYRLPSEAEWQGFAECGDGRKYPWGDTWPPRTGKAGNYCDETTLHSHSIRVVGGYRDGHAVSCDVAESWANPWGLYGVGGNVWEICAKDASGVSFGAWRGASWRDYHEVYLRCSYRYCLGGSPRSSDLGFRLVLSR